MYCVIQHCHFTKLPLVYRFYRLQQLCEHLCISKHVVYYTCNSKDGDFSRHVPNSRIVKVSPSAVPQDCFVDDNKVQYKIAESINEVLNPTKIESENKKTHPPEASCCS